MWQQHSVNSNALKRAFHAFQVFFSINNMPTYAKDRRRKRSTLRRRKKRRSSKRRSNDGRGKYARSRHVVDDTAPIKIENSDGATTPNINRIFPLRHVSSIIMSKTVCKSCSGNLSFQSDNKRTQVTEFICDGCGAVIKLTPSKLIAVNGGRKKKVREHVVRQTLAIATSGSNYNQFSILKKL